MASEKFEKGSRSLRVFTMIEAVIAAGGPVTALDLMATARLPKATVHRLCALLEKEGYLRRDTTGRGFVTGPRLERMAFGVLSGAGHRALTHAILEHLAAQVRETCNLNVPDGGAMLYVDRIEAEWPLRLQLPVGTRVPLHCTASGKLYLSSLPERERSTLMRNLHFERRTANTCTDPQVLKAELARIRASGVGVDDEEFLDGMTAVAVPILNEDGRLCATLAVHAPTLRMNVTAAMNHVPALRRAAAEIADALDITPPAEGGQGSEK